MSYTNADGLYVLTFKDKGAPLEQGTISGTAQRTLVVDIDLTKVGSTFDSTSFTPQWPVIPARSVITRATLVMTEAATSGGAPTLTIGTYRADTGAAVDDDAIDAAVALTAIDAIGDVVRCDGAGVTGVVGVGANDVVVGPIRTVPFYTGGKAKLYVDFIEL